MKLKFTKSSGQRMELNQKLIDKTRKLLGIKGYYTNLPKSIADNQTIIERYRELYRIEQIFRISKMIYGPDRYSIIKKSP